MNKYVIAKYIRLSVEDEKADSLSIFNQRMILDRHIESLEIPNVEILEFTDNGFSGTNMERPSISALLELVRTGKINAIAVKDFSRFSRNSMDSGYFIEQVFPLYGVRFIAVSDGFDSNDYANDTGGIDVAFKFLMHEYYSQDLSKKVKSARRIKMASGENVVKRAIYGYEKVGNAWEPQENSAYVVRKIFEMALQGKNSTQIRDYIFSLKIPTPQEHLEIFLFKKEVAPKCIWTTRMVTTILQNEQYAGTYISGKQESKAVGSHSKNHVDKDLWIKIPNHHTPIISMTDFEKVQELFRTKLHNCTSEKPIDYSIKTDETLPKRRKMLVGDCKLYEFYGYKKSADGISLEVDKKSAKVVEDIFEMALSGLFTREIAAEISKKKYPNPSEYKTISAGKKIKKTCIWTTKSVNSMLRNIQYTGTYVSGTFLYDKTKGKRYHIPKCDWVIIPDKFPPIISKEKFDEVQNILEQNAERRKNMRPREFLLRGNIVKCGCCGYAMYFDSVKNPQFRCQHTLSDVSAECHKLKISVQELDKIVLKIIKKQAKIIFNTNLSNLKINTTTKNISDFEKEIDLQISAQQKFYEKFILGEISKEIFQTEKSECSEKIDYFNSQISILKQTESDKFSHRKSAELADKILSEKLSEREIVELLIDKIFIFPNSRIEIKWKISDFTQPYK